MAAHGVEEAFLPVAAPSAELRPNTSGRKANFFQTPKVRGAVLVARIGMGLAFTTLGGGLGFAIGGLGLVLSPIIVHGVHGRAGVGVGGLVMRAAGAGLGGLGGGGDGAIAGYLVAAAIDIVALCREPVAAPAEPGIVPAVSFLPGGGVVGLARQDVRERGVVPVHQAGLGAKVGGEGEAF